MEYLLTWEQKRGYLHFRIVGNNTAENVRRWVTEGLELCITHKCHKVLVEENLTGPSLGVGETFWIIDEGCRKACDIITDMAYIDANPTHQKDMLEFSETVARNRGINMRVFSKVDDAVNWLKGDRRDNMCQ